MVLKTMAKISGSKHVDLIKSLGEDKAVELIKYCYKAFELVHRKESEVVEVINYPKLMDYLNTSFKAFYTAGIARTGFERGDLYDAI